MPPYPTADFILVDLGDKVVNGLAETVEGARSDLADYRQQMPEAVSRAGARGLANWIHDAMWDRARNAFDGISEVQLLEKGPTRDIYVGLQYRIRLKMHSATGAIRSYPTPAALDFVTQEPDFFSLLGHPRLNLTAGYEWDRTTRTMGPAVLSLRDGSFDDVIWMVDLPTANVSTGGATVAPIAPVIDGPPTPTIDVPAIDAATDSEGQQDS